MNIQETQVNPLFLVSESLHGFDETVQLISEAVTKIGWKISFVHDLQETLRKNGKEVLPVKVIELCNPAYSGKLLSRDAERAYSSLMPCRLSVYAVSSGQTYVSRLNAKLLAAQIGGVTEEVMGESFLVIEGILSPLIKM